MRGPMETTDLTVERIEELRLGRALERTIAQLLKENFSADFQGRTFFHNRHHCRFLVWADALLVGHLAIAYRAIQLGQQRVDIVGIAEVAVAKTHRRQGIGSNLVASALDEGRKADADFAALFGTSKIYSKAGFVPAPNMITVSNIEGARTGTTIRERNRHFMVKPLGNEQWRPDAEIDLAGFPF